MLVYLEPLLIDYLLFFVIPGFMAMAYSGRLLAPAGGRPLRAQADA